MPPFFNRVFSQKNFRTIKWLLAACSVLSVAALYVTQNPFLEAFEAKAYDLRFSNLRGPIPANPNIAIIAIDDKSIAELGRFPWSRVQYVRLLNRLSAAGAKVVVFDAFFPEPETPAIDGAFAEAIREARNVVLGVSLDLDEELHATGRTRSIPLIQHAAIGIGHINLLPEDDGVNRRVLLLNNDRDRPTPSLGLMSAMAALGQKDFTTTPFAVRVGERTIPVDGNYAMWINYTGGPGSYPRYSFADVAAGHVAPELLKNKVLFVGATALGIYDMRVTPFFRNVPGVEIHAAVADNILSGRFVRRTGIESLFDITAIIVLGSLTFFLTMRSRSYNSAIAATVVLTAAYLWLSYWMFLQGHWVSMLYPPLAAATMLVFVGGFRYLVLDSTARNIRAMFSSYMSDKLVAQLEENPEMVRIGGDDKEVTVLFTDIKSFTSFSEQHTAQEVVSRLNEYLAEMVHVIHEHDGRVDKFIGDGIMANWGAPIAQPDHATRAVACALAMQKTMLSLTAKWRGDGVEPFSIRGGLQSGEVVAGNIGSHGKKMEYTLIGDTVNQASRLEGAAKYYGVNFLVGENTYLQTRESFRYRELDRIRVVGKQTPVAIYELRGTMEGPADSLTEQFGAALALYRARKWADATQRFEALLEQYPDDAPSGIYLERCRQFLESPPPADWDGVYNRLDK